MVAQVSHPNAMTETALSGMHDIALPPPVSWMPQTFGWALLGLILLAGLAIAAFRWFRNYRANAYRREALLLLKNIEVRLRHEEAFGDTICEVAELLKRTALATWPREKVAALSGREWVDFLDQQNDGKTGDVLKQLLNDAEYRSHSDLGTRSPAAGADLITAARKWIEQHHVSA
ncbi:DUF4381 domain-containing protein [Rhizobium rhizogenes]|uniref:DUF4381 domain-containing protein n=1 Tax=Rhizobium rhizogenes (strain K84 / ATCC BAA-868) TaxID=311403 RepID=B9JNW2_RHIR8|nr:conserved hypothetical protein [Rhizobium rhizogenes K84]